MRHSKLVPGASLKKEKLSINQIAELIINFYKKLSEENSAYKIINVISEKKPKYPFIDIEDSDSVQILAREILHQNISDIRKYDGVDNPGLNYIRAKTGGIHIGLETKIEDETLISLTYSFYPNRTAIGPLVVNVRCFDTFEKAKYFLTAANTTFSVEYSAIKISDRELNRVARKYKAPLGWITYFSNDYEVPIPDDLQGIEYEYVENGKYLILTREDISTDEKKREQAIKKLMELMEQIEKDSPSYSRDFCPPTS